MGIRITLEWNEPQNLTVFEQQDAVRGLVQWLQASLPEAENVTAKVRDSEWETYKPRYDNEELNELLGRTDQAGS
jgi:hypothetical protein